MVNNDFFSDSLKIS